MPDADGESMIVKCTCGAKLKVKSGNEGRKFKCPKCQNVVRIPTESYDLSPPPDAESDLMEGLRSLAASSETAATVAESRPQRPRDCPRCNASMAGDAILCISCGYNTQTGRMEKIARISDGAVRRVAVGISGFALGCVLSTIAALVGALAWLLIAFHTGFEIGWIAWAIGGLTGFAMYAGFREHSDLAGYVAAGLAAFSIVLAKAALFGFAIYAATTGDTSNPEFKRAFIVVRLADERLNERGVFDPKEREAKWEATTQEVEPQVRRMSDAEIDALCAKYKEDDERDNAYSDETGRMRTRIADHRAMLRARAEGLPPYSDRQTEFYKQEFSKVRSLDENALRADVALIEAWENGGRWEDADEVRSHLIFALIEDELADEQGQLDRFDLEYPEDDEWKSLYDETAAGVDAMPEPDRLTKAKELQQDREGAAIRERNSSAVCRGFFG